MKIGWAWFAYSSIDEAYGILAGEQLDEPLMQAIATPFPRAIAGGLDSIRFEATTRQFEVQVQQASALPAEIALPLRWQYAQGACVLADGKPAAQITAAGIVQPLGLPLMRYNAARAVLTLDSTPQSLAIHPLEAGCA